MKRYLTLLFLLFYLTLFSQSGINYKAVIKDGGGNILASSPISIQFIIYEGAALTNNVYQESHTTNTNANGLVIVNIGEGTTADVFEDIEWGIDEHFLNVQVNTGSGLVDLGTTQFMAVPYALNAINATNKIDDLIDGKSDNDGTNDGSSIFLGTNAGANDDGTNNRSIGIGWEALTANATGSDNTAIGNSALATNSSGNANVSIGTETLFNNNGNNNIGIGYHALLSNTTGSDNIGVGYEALVSNTTGVNNNAYGTNALSGNTTGFFNNAFGRHALQTNTTGPGNTAIGHGSLRDNTTGGNNTALGNGAGDNVNGNDNVFVGRSAGLGLANSTNSGNVVIGNQAGSGADYNNRLYIDNSNTTNPLLYGEFDANLLRVNGTFDINNAYQFPTIDGSVDQILQTDGAGTLTWEDNTEVSGLEALDEGNGIGWRLIGKDPSRYLNIGLNAIDFSTNPNIIAGATGSHSFASGLNTTASGNSSTALGGYSTASGSSSTAIGSSIASGTTSTAMGFGIASGFTSTAMGNGTASGSNSTAMGNGTASGINSTAIGFMTKAEAYASVALGRYNVGGGNPTSWVANDPLFEIGIGFSGGSPSNAITVLKNGNVGIGIINPNVSLDVNGSIEYTGTITDVSDERLKENFIDIDNPIQRLQSIKGYSYNMKNDPSKRRENGVIAQDVQKVFPEMVSIIDEENGYLGVSYIQLIPVLLEAIKEQQTIINAQKAELNALSHEMKKLKDLTLRINELEANQKTFQK